MEPLLILQYYDNLLLIWMMTSFLLLFSYFKTCKETTGRSYYSKIVWLSWITMLLVPHKKFSILCAPILAFGSKFSALILQNFEESSKNEVQRLERKAKQC